MRWATIPRPPSYENPDPWWHLPLRERLTTFGEEISTCRSLIVPGMSRLDNFLKLHSQLPAIAPSMLKCDFADLREEMKRLEAASTLVYHWDVMDGHFVPNLSYGAMLIERVRPLTSRPFDAHLMIADPGKYLDDYIRAGCDAITIHIEAVPEPRWLLERIRKAGCAAGIAINPKTPVSTIESLVGFCDLVLIMSVEPGFGGQSFIPAALDKLPVVRKMFGQQVLISIDGGIGQQTIASAAAAGADVFVAGSAIFDQPDYRAAIRDLHHLAQSNRRAV